MNPYLRNLSKIEFVLTNACTGRCKHCSEGEHSVFGEHIDPKIAVEAIQSVVAEYDIQTVMVFGGEPLLYPEAVYDIMHTAKQLGVPRRQVITNGYFSKKRDTVAEVAKGLFLSGVNDLLVSVDAFHQETIPLDTVREFAIAAKTQGIPTRLQPAWLISAEDENPYNQRTRELLESFSDTGIPVSEGNVVFPEGNALIYLSEYFLEQAPKNPYVEDPHDVRCLSFSPNGEVLCGNVYKEDIRVIIDGYLSQEQEE